MDFSQLKKTLAPLYRELHAGQRWDQAERVATRALSWIDATDSETDRDLVLALAYCLAVRDAVCQPTPVRSSVEACLVEQGWTPLRTRELVRSLERLPDRPDSHEERLVADADTLTRLGVLGLVRQVAASAHGGDSLEQAMTRAHRTLSRRAFTPAAQAESVELRDELRDLLTNLRSRLESFR